VILIDFGMRATSAGCRGVVTVVWACAAITAAVLTTMIYSIIAFHRSASNGAATRMPSISAQILWSLIPIGILLGIAVPVVKALLFTDGWCGL
jgi:heme/copper-type cytochrome/quinol oxidase subunit 2